MAMSSLAALSPLQAAADAVVSQAPSPFPSSQESVDGSDLQGSSQTFVSIGARSNRKRRAAAQLSRIDLSAASALSGSNESLNSAGGATSDSDDAGAAETPTDALDFEKRSRFVSTSSSQSSASAEECYDLAEIECSSAKSCAAVASGGQVVGNGEYELVGDGRGCKAVHVPTQTIYYCQVMKPEEYKTFTEIACRVEKASAFYTPDEFAELKQLILPDGLRVVPGERGVWYLLTPDHEGNLHSFVQPATPQPTLFPERTTQQIVKQVVRLVELCHRCGLYFRDFRLRKFVFANVEATKIRLSNVLDLHVAADISDDSMSNRNVCPAYVAPEVLDINHTAYSGRRADIWALGVFMFTLLTGGYPFNDRNPTLLFRRIKCRKFSTLLQDCVSADARWLLYGILRSNPLERPTATEIACSHWLQKDPKTLPDVVLVRAPKPPQPQAAPAGAAGPRPTQMPAVTVVPPTPQPSAPAFVRFTSFPGQPAPIARAAAPPRVLRSASMSSRMGRPVSVSPVDFAQETLTNIAARALRKPQPKPVKPEEDHVVPDLGADFSRPDTPASTASRSAAPPTAPQAAGPHSRL